MFTLLQFLTNTASVVCMQVVGNSFLYIIYTFNFFSEKQNNEEVAAANKLNVYNIWYSGTKTIPNGRDQWYHINHVSSEWILYLFKDSSHIPAWSFHSLVQKIVVEVGSCTPRIWNTPCANYPRPLCNIHRWQCNYRNQHISWRIAVYNTAYSICYLLSVETLGWRWMRCKSHIGNNRGGRRRLHTPLRPREEPLYTCHIFWRISDRNKDNKLATLRAE